MKYFFIGPPTWIFTYSDVLEPVLLTSPTEVTIECNEKYVSKLGVLYIRFANGHGTWVLDEHVVRIPDTATKDQIEAVLGLVQK